MRRETIGHAGGLVGGLLVLSWAVAGCATTGRGGGKFPAREELQRLASTPSPTHLSDARLVEVERWQLKGPLPDETSSLAHHDETPWTGLLERAAAPRAGLLFLSEAMHCVARETGLFYLEHQGLPGKSLSNFIQARCGAAAGWTQTAWVAGEAPEGTPEPEVFARWKDSVEQLVASRTGGGAEMAGLWFGRAGNKAVAMLARAKREALVEPVAMRPGAGGEVVIRGELTTPAESVKAVLTRGRFGFGHCEQSEEVKLPRFMLRCSTSAADETAWIEIAAFPAGRVLGHTVLRLLVAPSGAPAASWVRPEYGLRSEGAMAPGPVLAGEVTRLVNQVRADAQLGALELASTESATAAKLAPYYFAAGQGDVSEAVADKVVLGLEAGWDVQGVVRHSWFTSAAMLGAADPAALLNAALELPSGREALLRPDARQLAVGAAAEAEAGRAWLGCVMTTYSLFEPGQQAAELETVRQRFAAARAAHRMAVPSNSPSLRKAMDGATADVERGATPNAALRAMIDRAAEATPGTQIRGWYLETSSLEDFKVPEELAALPAMQLEMTIAHGREEGAAWGSYVVFFVATLATSA